MSDMQISQAEQAETVWRNPELPAVRDDIREMSQDEWRAYREGIKRILCSPAESDEVREMAFEMLKKADRRLWVNGLANRIYWK